ncbi:MAG: hypothetical protein OXM55_00570 [Bdellovibrionales bacterium]|nr:hypothetical protein [Bdellovibrionales bacterium]
MTLLYDCISSVKQFAGRGSKAIGFLPKKDKGRPERGKAVLLKETFTEMIFLVVTRCPFPAFTGTSFAGMTDDGDQTGSDIK